MDDDELDKILERLAECDTIESDEDGYRMKTELNCDAIDAIVQLRYRHMARPMLPSDIGVPNDG